MIDESTTFQPINIAILTVSDTRTAETDKSGDRLVAMLTAAGHNLADRSIVHDNIDEITARLHAWVDDRTIDCVITTGGTGVTGRDVTPEALKRLLGARDIPGFGELFRLLSYNKIGTSTVQSRACAVVARGTYIFALPGSPGAVADGWNGILLTQLDNRYRPCNFVELMPRLMER